MRQKNAISKQEQEDLLKEQEERKAHPNREQINWSEPKNVTKLEGSAAHKKKRSGKPKHQDSVGSSDRSSILSKREKVMTASGKTRRLAKTVLPADVCKWIFAPKARKVGDTNRHAQLILQAHGKNSGPNGKKKVHENSNPKVEGVLKGNM